MNNYKNVIQKYNLDTTKLPDVTRNRLYLIEAAFELFIDATDKLSEKFIEAGIDIMDNILTSELNNFIEVNRKFLSSYQKPSKDYIEVKLQMSDWYCKN